MTKIKRGEVTNLQKRAVDNIMSGEFKSKGAAMRDAGFSKSASRNPQTLVRADGVQSYLKNFEAKAVARFNMTLDEKIMDVYLDGLDADKPLGKHGEVIQDHKMRKEFADTIQESRGMMKSKKGGSQQIFNFFMFDKKHRSQFNEAFNSFVREKAMEDAA